MPLSIATNTFLSVTYLVFHVISNDNANEQCETNHTTNEDKQMNEYALCLSQHTTLTHSNNSMYSR